MRWVKGIAWVVLSAILVSGSTGCKSKHPAPENNTQPVVQDDGTRAALEAATRDKEAAERELQRLMNELASKDSQIAALQGQVQENMQTSTRLQKELEEFARRTPGTQAIDGGLRFEEYLLFDSGRAELKKSGQSALDKLVELLKGKDAYVKVEGHTDTDPIVKSASLWKSKDNFELGAYRALAVVTWLKGRGIPGDHMFLASYGEHKPLVDNTSKEAKSKNRRVEILIYDRKG